MIIDIDIMKTVGAILGGGGSSTALTIIVMKYLERRKTKDYEKNGNDRRNETSSQIAQAIDVKTEVTKILGKVENIEENYKKTEGSIKELWTEVEENGKIVAEIKGYIEGTKKQ